jgi:hypothetical protein
MAVGSRRSGDRRSDALAGVTRLLIWLGSPSLGSPLERLGKLGHLRPRNDRRVYLQIAEWVAGDCAYWDSRS